MDVFLVWGHKTPIVSFISPRFFLLVTCLLLAAGVAYYCLLLLHNAYDHPDVLILVQAG